MIHWTIFLRKFDFRSPILSNCKKMLSAIKLKGPASKLKGSASKLKGSDFQFGVPSHEITFGRSERLWLVQNVGHEPSLKIGKKFDRRRGIF